MAGFALTEVVNEHAQAFAQSIGWGLDGFWVVTLVILFVALMASLFYSRHRWVTRALPGKEIQAWTKRTRSCDRMEVLDLLWEKLERGDVITADVFMRARREARRCRRRLADQARAEVLALEQRDFLLQRTGAGNKTTQGQA